MDRSSQPRGPFNPVPAGDHSILRAEIALMLPLFYWRSRCELGLTACPFAVRRTDNGTALRRKESISTRWFFLVNPTAALRHSRPRRADEIVEVSLEALNSRATVGALGRQAEAVLPADHAVQQGTESSLVLGQLQVSKRGHPAGE